MDFPKNRFEIYNQFKKYVQQKDRRNMNSICKNDDNVFRLQAQQLFLKEYINKYPKWKSLLLYHSLGSGKTCTAITMAEELFKQDKHIEKAKVILPARLRTNFIDELMSPCAQYNYLDEKLHKEFVSNKTSLKRKNEIKKIFMDKFQKKYDLFSFEKLKIDLNKNKTSTLKEYIHKFTENSFLIIDEVHNLVTTNYDEKKAAIILSPDATVNDKDLFKGVKGGLTILFKALNMYAHPTCKMIFLTATPIFDNIGQLKELVKIMVPEAEINKRAKVKDVIEFLRGRVSFFPGTSINAYPKVEYTVYDIPFSDTQYINTQRIINKESENDELSESFMIKQRQVSLATLPKNAPITKQNIKQILENKKEYCPKIHKLIDVIESKPGKHVVFSNFIVSGLNIIEQALRENGWISWKESSNKNGSNKKVYALWDGSVKDSDKQIIKNIANSVDNIYGDKIRVILGSPSIKEGVSFKHIQHIHLMDPVWNQSAKDQVEGRAIRYCSHIDIDEKKHTPLKRSVVVNIYKSVNNGNSCDEIIYDKIIEAKKELIKKGELALKKVAIDHYLFRNIYQDTPDNKTPEGYSGTFSDIDLNDEDNVVIHQNKKLKVRTTCPKKRRPDIITGLCRNPDEIVRLNPQKFPCCYKKKKAKKTKNTNDVETTCMPKSRRPINGKCKEGFENRVNKHGDDCCFKIRKAN